MPKVSKEYSLQRRQQIIDAAYRCFARKGFHQTTMRDIYNEANLSAGAVYLYFDSKEEIIQASFSFDYERGLEQMVAVGEGDDPLIALESLITFFLQGLKSAAALGAGRVNVQGWGEAMINPRLEAAIGQVFATYQAALVGLIIRAQERGQLDPALDPPALGRLLLSLYYGLELQLALKPELEVDQFAATIITLLHSAKPR